MISTVCLSAAPRLRLGTTALGPFSIAVGANGAQQTVSVANIGTGTFNFTVTSSATWLTAAYQPASTCSSVKCGQIAITLATSGLQQGSYTGIITVTDPAAIDVPQTISVTVDMGGTVPDSLTFYGAPGGSAGPLSTTSFTTGTNARSSVNALWLSVACSGLGSYQFLVPCTVTANPKNLIASTYNGTVTFSGSTFTPDNKAVSVTFHVTTSPIADPGTTSLTFGASSPFDASSKQTQYVWINNVGQGTLTVNGTPTAAVDTGNWLSASNVGSQAGGVLLGITVDPNGVAAGAHKGTVTVASNAANGPTVFNVELDVYGSGAGPAIAWPRILNISNFNPGTPLSPGDIVAIYGSDMFEGDPYSAPFPPTAPLLTQVGTGNTQVLVNGTPAPIFYASYNQINFQIPFEVSLAQDPQIQVVRNSVKSTIGTVPLSTRAPEILTFGCSYANVCPSPWGDYGIGINNADGSFPIPSIYPIPNSHPATAGDIIVFYAVGLGQTSPAQITGTAATASPLPWVQPVYSVCFESVVLQSSVCTRAQYSGATPTAVGLYQINVQIPPNAPKGSAIQMQINNGQGLQSDPVLIAIQ